MPKCHSACPVWAHAVFGLFILQKSTAEWTEAEAKDKHDRCLSELLTETNGVDSNTLKRYIHVHL